MTTQLHIWVHFTGLLLREFKAYNEMILEKLGFAPPTLSEERDSIGVTIAGFSDLICSTYGNILFSMQFYG